MGAIGRLGSKVLNAALVGLVLLTCFAWVRSYLLEDCVYWYGPPYPNAEIRQAWQCATGRGGVAFYVQTHRPGRVWPFPMVPTGFGFSSNTNEPRYAGAGLDAKPIFGFAVIDFDPIPTRGFVVPAWFLAALFAVRPSLSLWRHEKRKRSAGR